MRRLVTLIAILVLIAIGGLVFLYLNISKKPIGPFEEKIFVISPGETFAQVNQRLVSEGLVKNAMPVKLAAKLTRFGSKMKAGEYQLNSQMSIKEILDAISSGRSLLYSFTVSEGLNIYEIALLFEKGGFGTKEDFLRSCLDQQLHIKILGEPQYTCEGYLYPETYKVGKSIGAPKLVELMMKKFVEEFDKLKVQNELGWTRQEIVTLASIIEKETGAPEERPLISSVFHNRLNKRMRLQTDPTVLYGILDKTKTYSKNITKRDLLTPTKYNTYTKSGLPFGPIGNPGRDAILAAMQPETSPYLFFVSRNNGTHIFSETYGDHRKAVSAFQLNSKAREGKSWRDLKKTDKR